VATKAPASNGIVLALSCAAQFMVVLDGSESRRERWPKRRS
jgi:hypothetical protein